MTSLGFVSNVQQSIGWILPEDTKQETNLWELFGFLLRGERVVKSGNALFKLVHRQRPIPIEERRHRLGDLSFPPTLGLPVSEGNPDCVKVIEPDRKYKENKMSFRLFSAKTMIIRDNACLITSGSDWPFEGGRQLPHVVRVHPRRVLLQRHQEDILLFVGGVESQDTHHDEVRDEGQSGTTSTNTSQHQTHPSLTAHGSSSTSKQRAGFILPWWFSHLRST